jgi:uncharacterized membrane protein
MERYIEKEKPQKQTHPETKRLPSRQSPEGDKAGTSDRLGRFLGRQAEKVGGSAYRLVRAHWLALVNFHIFLFVGGALIAPCLLYLDLGWASEIVYRFYGLFCHQKASRSLFLFGGQVAICTRCVSFYSSILLVGMWVGLRKPGPLSFRTALLLSLPAMISVLLQTLGLSESTNLIRLTTGALLGTAISLYLFPRAQKALERLETEQDAAAKRPGGRSSGRESRAPSSKA